MPLTRVADILEAVLVAAVPPTPVEKAAVVVISYKTREAPPTVFVSCWNDDLKIKL
jgi:hypothetical protein